MKADKVMLIGKVDSKRGGFVEVVLQHKFETLEVIEIDEKDEEIPLAVKLNGRKIWLFNSEFVVLE